MVGDMEQRSLFTNDQLKGPTGTPVVQRLREKALECHGCNLCRSRKKVVFGTGLEDKAKIAFVGEGPGRNENELGQPFIGNAGKLLDRMLKAMGVARDEVYICNVVCCWPPNNRKPAPDEIAACSSFLSGQLRAVDPKAIVALGATAAQALIRSNKSISDLRGKWYQWEGTPLRASFHPAYLLRDHTKKKDAWTDLQAVMEKIGLVPPE